MTTPTLRNAPTPYGKRRVIDYPDGRRQYVHRTNLKTYVVTDGSRLTMDGMVEIAGEFHFRTLKALRAALQEMEA